MRTALLLLLVLMISVASTLLLARWRAVQAFEAKAQAMGLKAMRVDRDGAKVSFNLVLRAKPVCTFAAGDMAKKELAHSQVKKMLISVEPLVGEGRGTKGFAKPVDIEALGAGLTVPVTLTVGTTRAPLGVFLCKDSAGLGHCIDKDVTYARNWARTYFSPREKLPAGYAATDKIYLFNLLLLDDGVLQVPTFGKMHDLMQDEFRQYVASLVRSPRLGKRAVERLDRLNLRLESEAPYPTDGGIAVFIPHGDPHVCAQRQEETYDDVWR
jgi:hypothetical protein